MKGTAWPVTGSSKAQCPDFMRSRRRSVNLPRWFWNTHNGGDLLKARAWKSLFSKRFLACPGASVWRKGWKSFLLFLFLAGFQPAFAGAEIQIRCEPADSLLAVEIQSELERALADWGTVSNKQAIRVILAPDRESFSKLAGGRNPEWAAALILERGESILLDKDRFLRLERRRQILRHEMAHILIDRELQHPRLPRWFHEGWAQVFAVEWDVQKVGLLARTAILGRGIPLSDLRRSFPSSGPRATLAYAESQAALRYLMEDPSSWSDFLSSLKAGEDFFPSLQRYYDLRGRSFEAYFDQEILPAYRWGGTLLGAGWVSLGLLLFLLAAARKSRRIRRGKGDYDPQDYDSRWIDREKGA